VKTYTLTAFQGRACKYKLRAVLKDRTYGNSHAFAHHIFMIFIYSIHLEILLVFQSLFSKYQVQTVRHLYLNIMKQLLQFRLNQ